jgi:glycerophosphoryl diester phosphodiesterase
MRAALAIPTCDGLEFDVRGSADGVPVLLHDASLARVQGIDANVGDLTAGELARYGIPTLADVLAEAGAHSPDDSSDQSRRGSRQDARLPFLDVELKGEPVPDVIPVLEAARGPLLDRAVVSSFEPATLAWLGERRPEWPRWLNAMDLDSRTIDVAVRLRCMGISVERTAADRDGLRRAAQAGLEVAAWTVRAVEEAERLEELGVVAICAEAEALDDTRAR